MRRVYRVIFLVLLFIGTAVFFAFLLPETGSFQTTTLVKPGAAALPTIAVETCGESVGCLYGYSGDPETLFLRDMIVPVDSEAAVTLKITEYDMKIRRLKYELMDASGDAELCSGTINALEKMDGGKSVRIKLKADLKEGTEYRLRITLINSLGKRIYYFTRVKFYSNPNLFGKLAFIRDFSEKTMSANPEEREKIIPYLEMEPNAPEGSFSYVNIHSNYRLVAWEGIAPKRVTEPIITITEFYGELLSVRLDYQVTIDTGFSEELLQVEEQYRIRYLSDVVHLLNYDRYVETIFDSSCSSLSQSDLKLGICAKEDETLYRNEDNSAVAFIRNGSLYEFSLAKNEIAVVFSSEQKEINRLPGQQGEHSIKVLNFEKNGDITFLVSGYMKRGSYEGKVGLFLYRYHKEEGYLSELLYIPVSISEQPLAWELGDYFYQSSSGEFFFLLYQQLYRYNPVTGETSVLAAGLTDGNYYVPVSNEYIAYQSDGQRDSVTVFFPESGLKTSINGLKGEYVRLLSGIDNSLICGYGYSEDIAADPAGNVTEALYRVSILSPYGVSKKEYRKEGTYVTGAKVNGTIIALTKVKKSADCGYEKAEDDFILGQETVTTEKIVLQKRVTDKMLSEYYISFPAGFVMEELPKQKQVPFAVVKQDTTLRLKESEEKKEKYYVFTYGRITGVFSEAGKAVLLANAQAGSVIDIDGHVVFERGVRTTVTLTNLTNRKSGDGKGSIAASLQMMLEGKGIKKEITDIMITKSLPSLLSELSGQKAVNLTGISCDELFYYINKGQPVMACVSDRAAVVITGYRVNSLLYYDPVKGRSVTVTKEEAEELFGKNGFVFIGYLN